MPLISATKTASAFAKPVVPVPPDVSSVTGTEKYVVLFVTAPVTVQLW
jgi:hypothetical protein